MFRAGLGICVLTCVIVGFSLDIGSLAAGHSDSAVVAFVCAVLQGGFIGQVSNFDVVLGFSGNAHVLRLHGACHL